MARKSYFKKFYEKASEILVACNLGKGHDYQYDYLIRL